jgi:hypothetical protein
MSPRSSENTPLVNNPLPTAVGKGILRNVPDPLRGYLELIRLEKV